MGGAAMSASMWDEIDAAPVDGCECVFCLTARTSTPPGREHEPTCDLEPIHEGPCGPREVET
jgi:hypothetical protein